MSGDSQNTEGSQMSAMIFVNMECFTFFPTFERTNNQILSYFKLETLKDPVDEGAWHHSSVAKPEM